MPSTPYEASLAAARSRQRDPPGLADYRAHRPKVERKLAHLLRRRHGGRRVRVQGLVRGSGLQAAGRRGQPGPLATLGLRSTSNGWQIQPA